MKNRKKLLAALLAGAMTLSMGATAFAAEAEDGYAVKATNTEATSPDNDLVIAIEGSVSSMDPANIPADIREKWYPERDFHTMYIAEIQKAYIGG